MSAILTAAGDSEDGGEAVGDLNCRLLAALKASDERGEPPLLLALELARSIPNNLGLGVGFQSFDLGHVFVTNLCFSHNSPALWKLLEQSMACRIVCPVHVLALLTPRVLEHRIAQPEAFRLYLELLGRYGFSSPLVEREACRDKLAKLIDDALQLSRIYEVDAMDFGYAIILFFFTVITSLIDSTMEDWGLPLTSFVEHANSYHNIVSNMNVEFRGSTTRHEHRENLRRTNRSMAFEVLATLTSNKKAKVFLRLIHLNMPEKFNSLLQRLQVIEAHVSASQSLISMKSFLDILFMNIRTSMSDRCQLQKHQLLGALVESSSGSLNSSHIFGAGKDACWISFDMFLENAMDARHVYAISSADILAELIKTLQVINRATWQETFQALWVSALRFIQRDCDPIEGPVPHLDARLCLLLSIVPLAISSVVQEERELPSPSKIDIAKNNSRGTDPNQLSSRQHGLISCLQLLGQYSSLLSPPPSVVNAANHAATKAAAFVSNSRSANGNPNIGGRYESSVKAGGNMLHLIVEACIARNLIDTSAYFWPGYVVPSALPADSNFVQDSPWSTFLGGSPMTASLKNSLIITPASSLVEVEKLYLIALNGSDEEKAAAAKILCGASLLRGWNIQELVVHMVVQLLSPPMLPDSPPSGMGSHLIRHMPVLSAVLFGISCVDAIHILSLYGMVPEVAAALMPICEAFGSLPPSSSHLSSTSEEPSISNIFSCSFLFLLKLWKFYRPPQEHCIAGRGGHVSLELTLDYLLLMHNSLISSKSSSNMFKNEHTTFSAHVQQKQPVYIDSFPKLRAWYFQNQACIASTLSGLSSKNPVHQVANKILNLICRKMAKSGTVSGSLSSNSSSSASGSPINLPEDSAQWQMLPAWEVLEAIPFVLEAVLTACAHGRLSSRDLTTGLRDLVDLFPASVATIISYFSAEITRGIWKPVPMDGTSWPSPASALPSIESEVKEILASVGVHIQSCYPSGMPPQLPLPVAALVSLTITFKLDKNLEYIHGLVGQASETCAAASSWPSMPIIAALWTQKVRRWHDFIVLSCSRSPFIRDKHAIAQLISSCFSSFLGPFGTSTPHLRGERGVYGLLGQTKLDQGVRLLVKPGLLYLRSCRTFHDTHFLNKVIFKLVIEWAHKLANECSSGPSSLKSCRISLTAAASGVRQAAMLGATLLLIAGGPHLVQLLYEETLPTMLLSAREENQIDGGTIPSILEGYAMAYMLFVCGAFLWGVGNTSPAFMSVGSARRARLIGVHMDFIAGVMEGNILLACDPGTWKAYVLCYVGLLVRFVPAWIPEVKQETLQKLANGLRSWHEYDLALSLLEQGGPAAMKSIVEMIL